MPNWVEGTIKIRGERARVEDFIAKRITGLYRSNGYHFISYKQKTEGTNGIEGLSRCIYDGDGFDIDKEDDTPIVYLDQVKAAWNFKADEFVALSKEYQVDFRVYGIEMGVQFVREIEVIKGNVTLDKETYYDDWNWECPFPHMGG